MSPSSKAKELNRSIERNVLGNWIKNLGGVLFKKRKEKKVAFTEMKISVLSYNYITNILRLEKLTLSQMRRKPSISTINHVLKRKHML